jgi:hypothetical protein
MVVRGVENLEGLNAQMRKLTTWKRIVIRGTKMATSFATI